MNDEKNTAFIIHHSSLLFSAAASTQPFGSLSKMLTKTFAAIRRSIIAFAIIDTRAAPPYFPEIIGTGFVIDTNGIVVTNRHVVEALEPLCKHESATHVARALTFSEIERETGAHALTILPVSLRRWDKLTTFTSSEDFFGEQIPDIAFAQIGVSGLPPRTS